MICENSELAIFFDKYDLIEQYGIKSNQNTYDHESNVTCDLHEQCSVGIQTEIHPIPYAMDTNHTWNLWDLRREAIELAKIQRCKTKSSQTYGSSSYGTQS